MPAASSLARSRWLTGIVCRFAVNVRRTWRMAAHNGSSQPPSLRGWVAAAEFLASSIILPPWLQRTDPSPELCILDAFRLAQAPSFMSEENDDRLERLAREAERGDLRPQFN